MPITKEEVATKPPRGQRRGVIAAPKAESTDADKRPTAASTPNRSLAKGWGAVSKVSNDGFAKDYKPEAKAALVKYLDPEPFVVYHQHWLQKAEGKKSFNCLRDLGEDCPICDGLGDSPAEQVCFNIIDLEDLTDDSDAPLVKVWRVGVQVATMIKEYAQEDRTSPINAPGRYWAVKRTSKGEGKKKRYTTTTDVVKERDLGDDWETQPLDEATLAEYAKAAWTDERYVYYQTAEELTEVVEALVSSSDD